MRTIKWFFVISCLLLFGLSSQTLAAPLGTAFTYQGYLNDNGQPANGLYDFRFILYDAGVGGSQVGSTQNKEDVQVTKGFFLINDLDFGTAFSGDARFLEIAVRQGTSTGAYTILSPRQDLTPAPYSLYSSNAGTLGGQPASAFANQKSFVITNSTTSPTQIGPTCTNASGGQISITPTTNGKVVVEADLIIDIYHTSGQGDRAIFTIGGNSTDCNTSQGFVDIGVMEPSFIPMGDPLYRNIHLTRAFDVVGGTPLTFYVNGYRYWGTANQYFNSVNMKAVFYPN
jgi:hypothetical protein